MYSVKTYWCMILLWGTSLSAYPSVIPGKTAQQIFTTIFEDNLWSDSESKSGEGSTIKATDRIRTSLPALLRKYAITSLLDVSCGDFNWLSTIDLGNCHYTGMDIVEGLIKKNAHLYASASRTFKQGNAITDNLPKVDLILCRDMLVHFPLKEIFATFKNLKRSGAKYLLVTVQRPVEKNFDITMGQWRPLDFEKAPFNFPPPLCLLPDREHQGDMGRSKCLGLWLLEDLPL